MGREALVRRGGVELLVGGLCRSLGGCRARERTRQLPHHCPLAAVDSKAVTGVFCAQWTAHRAYEIMLMQMF